ncbi:MAG: CBS domain-containing protein [Alphaproteobacteria bacterium]|jgi:CBS domain-containing protein|nr:CBS domain-containing protein [Alphaproteobacteria bacterium]MBT7943855.1 CBS domain-containing protein [Alphaproteobacteria bacterium]
MTMLQRLLDRKGSNVLTIDPDSTVLDGIKAMATNDIGGLVVMEDGAPIGMFTERDYARNVFLKGKASPDTPIREAMATPVIFARPEQTVDECMSVMTRRRVRHLPVLDDGVLVGLVSIGDLVKNVIDEQKTTIEQLELYIHS